MYGDDSAHSVEQVLRYEPYLVVRYIPVHGRNLNKDIGIGHVDRIVRNLGTLYGKEDEIRMVYLVLERVTHVRQKSDKQTNVKNRNRGQSLMIFHPQTNKKSGEI